MEQPKRKTKLKDIAEAVGVSMTTVSFALSGKGRVSEEVRAAVEEAAERLGYERKGEDALPSKGRMYALLLNLDSEWDKVFSLIRPIIVEIETACRREGAYLNLLPVNMREADEDILKKIYALRCAGVFSIHLARESLFDRLEGHGVPVVVIMNGAFQDRYSSVLVDDYQGAYEGASHLLKLGHERIVYVDTDRLGLTVLSTDRYIGFRKALEERGLPCPPERKIFAPINDVDYLDSRIASFMASPQRPSAFFALDDQMAVRVHAALRKAGYRIPEDVSLLAPGDVMDYEDPSIPRITTMRINTPMMGRLAAEMMQDRIECPEAERHVIKIKQQLVQRGSTMALRRAPLRSVRSDTGRERVLAAFGFQETYPPPKWLGTDCNILDRLSVETGLAKDELRKRVGDDIRVLSVAEQAPCPYRPLSGPITAESLRNYPWPQAEGADLSGLRKEAESYGGEYALVGGDTSSFWHDAVAVAGPERLFELMEDEGDLAATLIARTADWRLDRVTRVFEEAGDLIDLLVMRNDFCGEGMPFLDPDRFARFALPALRRFVELAHRYGIKVLLETRGFIQPLLPQLIAAGVDGVHGFDPRYPGLDGRRLKRRYGKKLLLSGMLRQGRAEPETTLDYMVPGGGFIAAPCASTIESIAAGELIDLFDRTAAWNRNG